MAFAKVDVNTKQCLKLYALKKLIMTRGCPRGLMVKEMNFGIVVCVLEIQLRY